jgi:ATP-dependent RNA helicase DeaD
MIIPSGAEVCQKQLLALMHKVHEVKVNEAELEEFLPAVYEELKDLTKQELIKRFASIEFNRFLEYYRNAPDLNQEYRKMEGVGGGEERYTSTGSRFFINVGKMDNVDVSKLLEMLDDHAGVQKKYIGKIDLKGAYSFFEVEKEKAEDIIKGFTSVEYQGRQVRVELTDGNGRGPRSGGARSGGSDGGERKYGKSSSSGSSSSKGGKKPFEKKPFERKRSSSSGSKGKWG